MLSYFENLGFRLKMKLLKYDV